MHKQIDYHRRMKVDQREVIRAAIKRAGKKQVEIAQRIGVSLQDLNSWVKDSPRRVPEKHVPPLALELDLSPDAIDPEAADRWRKALRLHPPLEPKVITDIGPISARALAVARLFDALSPARQQIVDGLLQDWFAADPPADPRRGRRAEHGTHAQR